MDHDAAARMARALLDAHGLAEWRLGWDRAVRRAGQTRYRDRTITLSRALTGLHDEGQVRDTVLHEIAHALVGPRHGHDAAWRHTAERIGASAQRCLPSDSPTVAGRWVGECPAGHVVTRHRVPTRVSSCRECAPRFDVRHVHRWTRDGVAVEPHPSYVAELARLRQGTRHDAAVDVGARVRIIAPGRFSGRLGVVTARRRTRFAVLLDEGVVSVPFELVEPLGR